MTTRSNKRHASSLVAQRNPYARLCRAVILRAVQDLAHNEHRDEARAWLLSPESDYTFVTAGINANSIRLQLI